MHQSVDPDLDVITSAGKSAENIEPYCISGKREIKKQTTKEEVLNAFKLFYTD